MVKSPKAGGIKKKQKLRQQAKEPLVNAELPVPLSQFSIDQIADSKDEIKYKDNKT